MDRLLLNTYECLQRIENLFSIYATDLEKWEHAPVDELAIFTNPMLHLAEAIYMDNPRWATDLAKYLCVMCKINKLDVEINVK